MCRQNHNNINEFSANEQECKNFGLKIIFQ